MTLEEIVRERTFSIRDAVDQIAARCLNLQNEIIAAEDSRKRSYTEITKQRTLETERRRLMEEAGSKVAEAQTELEGIERQRSEAVDRLLERQAARDDATKRLKEAQRLFEEAQERTKDSRERIDGANRELAEKEKERGDYNSQLRNCLMQSVECYLAELAKRIEHAYLAQEDRQKRLAAASEFKKARHEKLEIGDLCDQLDQLRILVSMATVPPVREMLQSSIKSIEDQLETLYPGALKIEQPLGELGLIEDLHYYPDANGKAVFLLPIERSAWEKIESGAACREAGEAFQLLWSMAKELQLKPADGRFDLQRGWCVFSSDYDPDDVMLLEGFDLPLPGAGSLRFRLSPVPPEIREALTHANSNT